MPTAAFSTATLLSEVKSSHIRIRKQTGFESLDLSFFFVSVYICACVDAGRRLISLAARYTTILSIDPLRSFRPMVIEVYYANVAALFDHALKFADADTVRYLFSLTLSDFAFFDCVDFTLIVHVRERQRSSLRDHQRPFHHLQSSTRQS